MGSLALLFLFGAASFLKNHWIKLLSFLQMRELSFRGGTDLPKVTLLQVGGEAWSLPGLPSQPSVTSPHRGAESTCSPRAPETHRCGAWCVVLALRSHRSAFWGS